jgi:GT2 family glycosyltransferase
LLARCLTAVRRHALPSTDILVVDDASPQSSVSSVATAAGVRVLRFPRQRGFCAAVNAGLQTVGGEFVEVLNDDTEVTPGWAEAALAAFTDPSVAAVAPLVLQRSRERFSLPPCGGGLGSGVEPPPHPNPPPQGGRESDGCVRIDSAGDRYYIGGVAGKRGHGTVLFPEVLHPCRVFGASGSSAFYRRDALLKVGAFPESFGAYFEDVDLAFRLHRAGYEVRFEPTSRVWHLGAASHGPPRQRLLEQQSRNEERVFWRNLPGREMLRALPRHLVVLVAKAARRWSEGTLRPFLTGRLRVIGELSELLRHRRWLRTLGPDVRVEQWLVECKLWF